MVAKWFYQNVEGRQSGPIDSKELRSLADAGIVRPDTLIRQSESDSWARAERVRGLFQQITTPVPPPLPHVTMESVAPSINVDVVNPIRPSRGAATVNAASKKPDRIHPATWVAIISSTGCVLLLLLLLALVFRGGGERQNADKDPQHSVAAQSAESNEKEIVPTTPSNGFLIANDGDSSVIASETSQRKANEARVIRDPAMLYENSRIAVATISTKDSEGYDAGQGSGFFVDISQVEQFTPSRSSDAIRKHEKSSRRGYLLTNFHVIRAAATAKVRVHDFGVPLDAYIDEVVMEREDLDLALVSVSIWPPTKRAAIGRADVSLNEFLDGWDWGLAESKIPWWKNSVPTLEIADKGDPAVGMKVYAIGSPQGLEATLSEGIVSGYRSGSEGFPRLQFSAPVSPGSSGGPLVDETGLVVGVVTALHRGGQNLNFAVPASEVSDFLKGRCESRELWRGTSIEEELKVALDSVRKAFGRADERKKQEIATIEVVSDVARVANKTARQYREWLETLLSIEPSSCGDFEYLLHYARGQASIIIANSDIHEKFTEPVPKSEQRLPASETLASQLQRSLDHQAGIRFLEHSIQLNPKFSPAHDRLLEALSMSEQHAAALIVADRLVQIVPRCSEAFRARGSTFESLEQLNSALEDYQTAVELSPNNPAYHFSLGNVYDKLGLHDRAIESFETSIRLGNDWFEVDMRLAVSLQKTGRFSEAIVQFQEARAKYLAMGFQRFVDICDRSIADCRAKRRP